MIIQDHGTVFQEIVPSSITKRENCEGSESIHGKPLLRALSCNSNIVSCQEYLALIRLVKYVEFHFVAILACILGGKPTNMSLPSGHV